MGSACQVFLDKPIATPPAFFRVIFDVGHGGDSHDMIQSTSTPAGGDDQTGNPWSRSKRTPRTVWRPSSVLAASGELPGLSGSLLVSCASAPFNVIPIPNLLLHI